MEERLVDSNIHSVHLHLESVRLACVWNSWECDKLDWVIEDNLLVEDWLCDDTLDLVEEDIVLWFIGEMLALISVEVNILAKTLNSHPDVGVFQVIRSSTS